MFDISNRVAVITGGSGVLGMAMAKHLAMQDVKGIILGRSQAKIDVKVAELSQYGEADGYPCDVVNEEAVEEVHEKIVEKYGKVDILINAAGGNMPGAVIMPEQSIFDLSIEEFRKVSDLNLTGTVIPSKVFGRTMADQGKGCIINISSMAAYLPITRVVGYSAAKAAIDNFTKWMATEMVTKFGEGIRVNAIAPGFFITEQNERLLTNEDGSLTPRGADAIRNTPFKRFGKPEELNGTVHWLCSDEAGFVTGAIVPVDGGFSSFGRV